MRSVRGGGLRSWCGKNWGAIAAVRALLHFHLAEEHGGSCGGNGYVAAFRAADAVENVLLVAGGDDACESGKRSADNVDTANEFIGATVGINLINDDRQNLECLRQRASGEGKAALDVIEVQAIGLALLLDFVDELLAHLGFGNGLAGGDDQISLAAGGHQAG